MPLTHGPVTRWGFRLAPIVTVSEAPRLAGFAKAGFTAYDLWTGDDPVATADQPMTQALADALDIIAAHPLCTDTKVEQGDRPYLWFFIENDNTGDPSWVDDLNKDLTSYDQDGAYRITVYLPQVQEDDSEPDDQGPTAADRNPDMLRR